MRDQRIIVVAPHPDDETLGCGGTMLRHLRRSEQVHWLIATDMVEGRWPRDAIEAREQTIAEVAAAFGGIAVHRVGLPTTTLDLVPLADVIARFAEVFRVVQPTVVYLPWPGDAHSDHRVVFEAGAACCKSFRCPTVQRVLCYEVPSETDFGLDPTKPAFAPNVFVDITPHLEHKLAIVRLFGGEIGLHPFPRSEEGVRALAVVRGAAAGYTAAEAFRLVRETMGERT